MDRKKIDKIKAFLNHIQFHADEIDIAVDTEDNGRMFKLSAYREGRFIGGLSQETYNELVNSNEKDVLKELEHVINDWEEIKIGKLLGFATMSEKVHVKDNKIVYEGNEIDIGRVKQLAERNYYIKQSYEKILENIEKRKLEKKLEEEKEMLKKEIEKSWVRVSLAGELFSFEGMGTGDNLSRYYTLNIDEDKLPDVIKEKIVRYKIFLEDTSDTRDADSFLFPSMFKRRRLEKGWYYVVSDKVINEIRKMAEEMANDEDREIVRRYKEVSR